jgi:hypothetical protein
VAGLSVLGIVLTETPSREVVLHEHRTAVIVFCVALAVTIACALVLPGRAPEKVVARAG